MQNSGGPGPEGGRVGGRAGGLPLEVKGGKEAVSGAKSCQIRRRFHRSLYSIGKTPINRTLIYNALNGP